MARTIGGVNKSQPIRDLLKEKPKIGAKEAIDTLAARVRRLVNPIAAGAGEISVRVTDFRIKDGRVRGIHHQIGIGIGIGEIIGRGSRRVGGDRARPIAAVRD